MAKNKVNSQQIKMGVGVLLLKEDKVLLKKRKDTGEYEGSGGGHLEYMESLTDCAKREVKEEIGIEIKNIRFLCVSNIKRYAPKHYIDIGLTAEWKSGQPKIMEPNKATDIDWYDINNLQQPLTQWGENYINAYRTKKDFYDL